MVKFLGGVLLGGVVAGGVVLALWQQDRVERIEAYDQLNERLNAQANQPAKAAQAPAPVQAPAHVPDIGALQSCVMQAHWRLAAVERYSAGEELSAVEKGALQPLRPVIAANPGASMSRLGTLLAMEAAKLNNECLAAAI